ncbi:hypothetical protein BZZ01_03005 [Nostocales cyanobacterium HT-58-2]|nr:hypothetical protein BZZ01_03005 [Nostocales cyanobacterium HT-58-2]
MSIGTRKNVVILFHFKVDTNRQQGAGETALQEGFPLLTETLRVGAACPQDLPQATALAQR